MRSGMNTSTDCVTFAAKSAQSNTNCARHEGEIVDSVQIALAWRIFMVPITNEQANCFIARWRRKNDAITLLDIRPALGAILQSVYHCIPEIVPRMSSVNRQSLG
ncbi:unnamed protein product [Lasius platythorax]|uniref:Uncharacterized protein n=1 Tax=Lasius platythorax TaxID=488582 RepID=A0AAV2N3L9_9HYME